MVDDSVLCKFADESYSNQLTVICNYSVTLEMKNWNNRRYCQVLEDLYLFSLPSAMVTIVHCIAPSCRVRRSVHEGGMTKIIIFPKQCYSQQT